MKSGDGATLVAVLGAQAAKSGGQFLLSILLVRELGLDAFGALSLVLIVAGYGAGLAQALVAQPLLSLAPRLGHEDRNGWVRASAWLGLMLASAIALLACAFGSFTGAWHFLGLGDHQGWLMGSALVGGHALAPVLRAALFATGKRRTMMASDAALPWTAVALVLWSAGRGALSIEVAFHWLLVATGTSTALAVWGLMALPGSTPKSWLFVGARHWRSGRWLAGNQALSWFGTGGFHGATALLLGPAAVGAIRAAMGLVGVLLVACQALELALPSLAAKEGGGGRAWTARWSLGLGAGFAALGVTLTAGAPRLMPLLFPGQAVGPIVEAFSYLVWLPALAAVTCVLQVSFRAMEHTRPVFLSYAVSSGAAALAAIPLVRAHGLLGAAAGFTATQVVFALLLAWAFMAHTSSGRLGPATIRAT